MGYTVLGLDGEGEAELAEGLSGLEDLPVALALGAEGPGLRELTVKLCDRRLRIPAGGAFGSLNVSNAAAVALYAATRGAGRG
jgi:23S rRNA (guanosine2251-2'-O)-methyltransferase